jgi:hypothetical protein
MINNGMLFLQNCINLLETVLGLYNETCLTCHDENEVINLKFEVIRDIKEEEDPLLISSVIKEEREVSSVSVCIWHISRIQLVIQTAKPCHTPLWVQMCCMYEHITQDGCFIS